MEFLRLTSLGVIGALVKVELRIISRSLTLSDLTLHLVYAGVLLYSFCVIKCGFALVHLYRRGMILVLLVFCFKLSLYLFVFV